MVSVGRRASAAAAIVAIAGGALAWSANAAASATAPGGLGRWRTVPGPAVPASDSANLTALAMASPSLGWTAGFTLANSPPNAPFEPLLAAWNGRRWRTMNLARMGSGRLDGLAVRSASDAWAVGTAYPSSRSSLPLILHWNGRRWARMQAATVAGAFVSLLGVAVRSATDAWAVGEAQSRFSLRPVIEHWDGRRWRLMPNPPVPAQTALTGVTVAADGEAWAVGVPFRDRPDGLVLHWTGRTWVTSATPKTSTGVLLDAVTAISAGNVWAVGSAVNRNGPYRAYALHWNGRGWASVRLPDHGQRNDDRELLSVVPTGRGQVVAVGSDNPAGAPGSALYAVRNGRTWSVNRGPHNAVGLNAVAYDGRHAIWAAGSRTTSPQTFRPVMQVSG